MKLNQLYVWIFQVIAAFVLVQSLWFKFSAAPESIQIFSQLGMEPWGRILIGLLELFAVIMLLVPQLAALGALLGTGIMIGAVIAHVTRIGIVVENDGGLLFVFALIVLVCCTVVLYLRRKQIPFLGETM